MFASSFPSPPLPWSTHVGSNSGSELQQWPLRAGSPPTSCLSHAKSTGPLPPEFSQNPIHLWRGVGVEWRRAGVASSSISKASHLKCQQAARHTQNPPALMLTTPQQHPFCQQSARVLRVERKTKQTQISILTDRPSPASCQ